MKNRVCPNGRQGGAAAIMVGLTIFVLIGFLGLALDLGRLFIVKTELQNAMDACALAAAGALNAPGQLDQAEARGIYVGESNKVDFQDNFVDMTVNQDVTFSTTLNGTYLHKTSAPADSKYAKCSMSQGGILPWFFQVLQQWVGAPTDANSVGATAVATLAPAQTSCAIPIGLCAQPGGSAPDFGLVKGKWEASKFPVGNASKGCTGNFNWIDFSPPSGGASELATLLSGEGECNVPTVGACVGESGDKQSLIKSYNTRFGVYFNPATKGLTAPTGVAYKPTTLSPNTKKTWRELTDVPQNAYDGPKPAGSGISNYVTEKAAHTPYSTSKYLAADSTYHNTNTDPETAGSSSGTDYTTGGELRRLVTVPIVNCGCWGSGCGPGTACGSDSAGCGAQQTKILGFACVLLLHPVDPTGGTDKEIFIEYEGAANSSGNPCASAGLGGGTIGPLVPVLVQ
jgi:hypothetical protein